MKSFRKPPAPRSPRSLSRRTPINTYYRADADNKPASPFQKKNTPRGVRRYFFGLLDIILILLLLAALGYAIIISPHPKVIVSNQAFHSQLDYQTYANQFFSQLKNRNKITFDENSLSLAMQKKFPEISSINVELPVFSERPTLRVSISKASLKVKSGQLNYIVDSDGVIVSTANKLPAASGLPQIVDQSGFKAQLGRPLLNAGAVEFIRTLVAETKAANVPVSTLTLPAVSQELDLRTSDQPYFVKFYLGGDALTQTGQYLAARNHFKQTNQNPSQYLDVRVAGKIFYK